MSFLKRIENKKICVITHIDLDGIGCIVVSKFYLENLAETIDYIFVDYDDIDTLNKNSLDYYDFIIFTDITPTNNLYNYLKENKKEVYIFDHHVTSFESLNEYDPDIRRYVNYFYDVSICGTQIFYNFIISCGVEEFKNIKQFVMLINVYDCWITNSNYFSIAKDLNNVLMGMIKWKEPNSIYKFSKFINLQVFKFSTSDYFYFTSFEKSIIQDSYKKEIKALEEAKSTLQFRTDNQGNKYAYFCCGSKLSLTAYSLLQEYKDLKYIVGHNTFKDKNGLLEPTLSLRSDNGINVSEIARQYGGGGHFNASGITFKDYDFFMKFHRGETHLI